MSALAVILFSHSSNNVKFDVWLRVIRVTLFDVLGVETLSR